MRISDWSSDVCSSELTVRPVRIDQDCHPPSHHVSPRRKAGGGEDSALAHELGSQDKTLDRLVAAVDFLRIAGQPDGFRSEEHTSELQSLMRISYAVFCLKKKTKSTPTTSSHESAA